MRRSWPDASEAFEGRVLTRGAVLVDFSLPPAPQGEGPVRSAEDSVLFVAPLPAGTEPPLEYDVDIDADGAGDARLAPLAPIATAFPGAHWRSPPPELSEAARLRMSQGDFGDVDDERTLKLPVLPLGTPRGVLDTLVDAGEGLVGETAAGRVGRLGVVVALLFTGLSVQAFRETHRAAAATTSADIREAPAPLSPVRPPVALAATSVVSPRVAVALPARGPVVISGAPPVWIVVPAPHHAAISRVVAAPTPRARLPEVPERLGLPRPAPPPPRTEFARL